MQFWYRTKSYVEVHCRFAKEFGLHRATNNPDDKSIWRIVQHFERQQTPHHHSKGRSGAKPAITPQKCQQIHQLVEKSEEVTLHSFSGLTPTTLQQMIYSSSLVASQLIMCWSPRTWLSASRCVNGLMTRLVKQCLVQWEGTLSFQWCSEQPQQCLLGSIAPWGNQWEFSTRRHGDCTDCIQCQTWPPRTRLAWGRWQNHDNEQRALLLSDQTV